MNEDGQGNGTLVPTGKCGPELAVSYDIGHDVAHRQGPEGQPVEWSRATVHSLDCNDGAEIPAGDFDLVDGGEMIRLKHVVADPEWLVTSSIP
jgi:hypothetical protein